MYNQNKYNIEQYLYNTILPILVKYKIPSISKEEFIKKYSILYSQLYRDLLFKSEYIIIPTNISYSIFGMYYEDKTALHYFIYPDSLIKTFTNMGIFDNIYIPNYINIKNIHKNNHTISIIYSDIKYYKYIQHNIIKKIINNIINKYIITYDETILSNDLPDYVFLKMYINENQAQLYIRFRKIYHLFKSIVCNIFPINYDNFDDYNLLYTIYINQEGLNMLFNYINIISLLLKLDYNLLSIITNDLTKYSECIFYYNHKIPIHRLIKESNMSKEDIIKLYKKLSKLSEQCEFIDILSEYGKYLLYEVI